MSSTYRPGYKWGDYHRELLTTGDAYLSSYYVDDIEFEEALKKLVGGKSA